MAATSAAVEMPSKAKEQAKSLFQKAKGYATRIGPLGWAAIVAAAALLATGTVIGLVVLTPVFIIFSPILVPLGIILFLCTAGVVTAAAAAIATVSSVTWLYRYYKGRHSVGSDKLDHAVSRVQDTAHHVQVKAKDAVSAVV